jgi:hypothetical protein
VFEERVGGEHRVVGLNDGGGDLGRGVNAEVKLGFLSVVNRESFEEERAETRSRSTTNGVEDQETLETGALIGELANSVEAEVNNLLSDGVMSTSVVVCSILLASDELFGVEQLTVGTGPHFINDSGFKVKEDSTGNVFASAGFREEGVEGIISVTYGLVRWHLAIRLDSVLEAIEFPASVTNLGTGLSNVD